MKKRFQNKLFLAAFASVIYTLLSKYLDMSVIGIENYQLIIDVLAYLLIGVGVYKDFGGDDKNV